MTADAANREEPQQKNGVDLAQIAMNFFRIELMRIPCSFCWFLAGKSITSITRIESWNKKYCV